MNSLRVLRAAGRFLLLILVIFCGVAIYPAFFFKKNTLEGKIAWMQWMARRFLWIMNARVSVEQPVPERGLIVSNHLGYVDILVIGSLCPALFVAKSDVQNWPVFGALTKMSGTLFVNRTARSAVAQQVNWIAVPLNAGIPVVLFPEGTSSDGTGVLPFRSSLLEAALETKSIITPAAISYSSEQKNAGPEIAYWGEMTLLPHLFSLFARPGFEALLSFGESRIPTGNRKEEAVTLHTEVSRILESKLLRLD